MRTVDVANAYNIRRRQLIADLENSVKEIRGQLTRAILNTDLSAATYEIIVNSTTRLREFDKVKLFDPDTKYNEVNRWLSNSTEPFQWSNNKERQNRINKAKIELDALISEKLNKNTFLERFYISYSDLNLVIVEDTLISIYTSEDISSLIEEIIQMLKNLYSIKPLGGLSIYISRLLETSSNRESIEVSDIDDSKFINTYADTTLIWSQAVQLIIDYIHSIENETEISLETANDTIRKRMNSFVEKYKNNQ